MQISCSPGLLRASKVPNNRSAKASRRKVLICLLKASQGMQNWPFLSDSVETALAYYYCAASQVLACARSTSHSTSLYAHARHLDGLPLLAAAPAQASHIYKPFCSGICCSGAAGFTGHSIRHRLSTSKRGRPDRTYVDGGIENDTDSSRGRAIGQLHMSLPGGGES